MSTHSHSIRRPYRSALVLAAGVLPASLSTADIIDVPGDFPTIAIALANAVDGDEIVLAPGLYPESVNIGTRSITIRGQNPDDPATAENTIIDAFTLDRCLVVAGGQGPETVIAGLTLRNGRATSAVASGRGGGAVVVDSSPTFRNVIFRDNSADVLAGGDGGGAFFFNSTSELINCQFLDNVADDAGGGAYFRDQTAISLIDCHFEGNVASAGSGAGFLQSNSTVVGTTFRDNGALEGTDDGGAVWIVDADVDFDRCVFVGNQATDDGSVIIGFNSADITIVNSVLRGNEAGHTGALYTYNDGTITVLHSTIVDNAGDVFGAAFADSASNGTMAIRNSISWNNGASAIGNSVIATDSTVEGGHSGPGDGNIALDPMLDADLRLLAGSPAIDAGNTLVLLGDDPRDFDGNPRAIDDPATADTGRPVYGLTADMGAFEFVPAGVVPTCEGDVDGNNVVDFNDLLSVLAAFGACP